MAHLTDEMKTELFKFSTQYVSGLQTLQNRPDLLVELATARDWMQALVNGGQPPVRSNYRAALQLLDERPVAAAEDDEPRGDAVAPPVEAVQQGSAEPLGEVHDDDQPDQQAAPEVPAPPPVTPGNDQNDQNAAAPEPPLVAQQAGLARSKASRGKKAATRSTMGKRSTAKVTKPVGGTKRGWAFVVPDGTHEEKYENEPGWRLD